MAKRSVIYPDWVEKYRGKGKTIRKTAYGYALYKCTSVYDSSKKYPKSVQEFLGVIDKEKGFLPKVKKNSNPKYLEFGLSQFISLNFNRDLKRSSYDGNNNLIKISIINFVFNDYNEFLLKHSYLTYLDFDSISYLKTVNVSRVKTITNKIDQLFKSNFKDDVIRNNVINALKLCVIDPATGIKPIVDESIKEEINKIGLKLW